MVKGCAMDWNLLAICILQKEQLVNKRSHFIVVANVTNCDCPQ